MKRLGIGVVVALAVAVLIVGVMALKDKRTAPPTGNTQTVQTPTDADGDHDGDDVATTDQNNGSAEETNSVTIENFAFNPATITVKKGTTVTWTNKDSAAHTVTTDSGSGPTSQLLNQGDSYTFTFNTAGTFNYHCQPHPNMKGTVIVE
jgi:amicyanin